jgi:hypothetical protein
VVCKLLCPFRRNGRGSQEEPEALEGDEVLPNLKAVYGVEQEGLGGSSKLAPLVKLSQHGIFNSVMHRSSESGGTEFVSMQGDYKDNYRE